MKSSIKNMKHETTRSSRIKAANLTLSRPEFGVNVQNVGITNYCGDSSSETSIPDWQTRNFNFSFNFRNKTVRFTAFPLNLINIDGYGLIDYCKNRPGVYDFMKSIDKIELTNMYGDTTVAFSVKYNSTFILIQTFDLIMDDAAMTLIKQAIEQGWPGGNSDVKLTRTTRVILFYKDRNGKDQKHIHSNLDLTKEELIDYVKNVPLIKVDNYYSSSPELNREVGANLRCNLVMGISCGDGLGSAESNNWKTLTPLLKWNTACKSIGKVRIGNDDVKFSYLCCHSDRLDDTCTAGCNGFTKAPADPRTYCI